jgi:hypothetical protein
MSQNKFSRHRRGMRFRPSKSAKIAVLDGKEAHKARQLSSQPYSASEPIFDKARFQKEIERSENVAAGLPPEGLPPAPAPAPAPAPEVQEEKREKRDFREPNLQTPAVVEEEATYTPVHIAEQTPKGPTHHQTSPQEPEGSHHQRRIPRNPRGRPRKRQT